MTHENSTIRRKGDEYGQTTYRPSWQVFCLSGLVWAFVIAVIVLWAGAARAQDYIIVDGMGGGTVAWGQQENNALIQRAINEDRPIRLDEGRYISAGTFLLHAVRTIPGSCVASDTVFGFHEAQSMAAMVVMCAPFHGEAREYQNRRIWIHYNEPLRRWFRSTVMGTRPSCGFHNLFGHQLAAFGYPVCEETQ
jgi:hypothetical protein